jgi:ubiquinone/menaquinone biosynthesis C-methylase UbiE
MSTYILMKILESSPDRYDLGVRILTLGKLESSYDRLASFIKSGQHVLDIGCGTGALTLRAAQKGANVKGIDINYRMLEIAHKRLSDLHLNAELCEMGVTELSEEDTGSYDVAMSGLCFSELSEDELAYTLKEIPRILKPGGLLLIADEVRLNGIKRVLTWIVRIPLVIVTYLITQTTTRAIKDLPERIDQTGLSIERLTYTNMGNFIELVAKKTGEDAR